MYSSSLFCPSQTYTVHSQSRPFLFVYRQTMTINSYQVELCAKFKQLYVQQALRIESYCCTSTKIIIKEIAARIINKTKTKQSKETNKKTRQKHKTTKEQRNKHLIGVTHCLSETTIKIEYNIYSIFVQTYVTMNKMT